MYKRSVNESKNTFVCLDDITEQPEPLNVVIYNPLRDSIPFRSELLFRTIKDRYGFELTSEQINHLVLYDVHQLDSFITELKDIVKEWKDKK